MLLVREQSGVHHLGRRADENDRMPFLSSGKFIDPAHDFGFLADDL